MSAPRIDIALDGRVAGLAKSATIAIQAESARRLAAGERVFKLGLGQSPFPVPASVVDALRANAAEKDYLPVEGLPALRAAVADYHRRRNDAISGPGDVLVGPGSKELMFVLQLAFDGEIVIPTPAWVSYGPQARLTSRRIALLETDRKDGYRLRAEALDAHCKRGGKAPRVLLLNTPNNPTGASYGLAQLDAIATVAREHGIVVLSDEIYGELHYKAAHASMARVYPEGTILSSGLSKWCGAGGWRLGTFTFPPSMRPLLEAMAAVASETFTTTSAPIQHAAVRAFRGGSTIERYLRFSRRVLSALSHQSVSVLREAGLDVEQPEAGFYLYPSFDSLRGALARHGIRTSPELAQRLLTTKGVACLPGASFMRDPSELTLRLSLVDFDGARALAEVSEREDEHFVPDACRTTVVAVERIADLARELRA